MNRYPKEIAMLIRSTQGLTASSIIKLANHAGDISSLGNYNKLEDIKKEYLSDINPSLGTASYSENAKAAMELIFERNAQMVVDYVEARIEEVKEDITELKGNNVHEIEPIKKRRFLGVF
jgi:regulator of PEP synthase PpsR (kinase-PPPase family)